MSAVPFRRIPGALLLTLCLLGALGFQGCGDEKRCEDDGIGPLAFNPQGYTCRHTCECNNQRFHGVCRDQRCEVLAPRRACPSLTQSLEVHQSNVKFSDLCPDLLPAELQRCTTGIFAKTCGGQGLFSKMWSDCRCVGQRCSANKTTCQRDCWPDQPCPCVDLQREAQHCGACGNACGPGFVCEAGQCQCSGSKRECKVSTCRGTNCPVVCIDIQNDAAHCGACGQQCEQGQLCAQGRCQEVLLQPGTYRRGTPFDDIDWPYYTTTYNRPRVQEMPHSVSLTRPFTIGKYEVSQGWFQQVMGYNPSKTPCVGDAALCPVEQVNLFQAMDFCNKLSKLHDKELCYRCDGKSGTKDVQCHAAPAYAGSQIYRCLGYRLPTDAEWEYAARAGTQTIFAQGEPDQKPMSSGKSYESLLTKHTWYQANASGHRHHVDSKAPNAWGLYHMAGHVAEWVWGGAAVFSPPDLVDPVGIDAIDKAVLRGGSLADPPLLLRPGARQIVSLAESSKLPLVGFRIARTARLAIECEETGLTDCGLFSCVDTHKNPDHCGGCGRKCSALTWCKGGKCINPEVHVRTRDASDKPAVWEMGLDWEPESVYPSHCSRTDTKRHQVRLTHEYTIWPTETTQEAFRSLMGFDPSAFACPQCPTESVTWFQALAFTNAMSQKAGLEPCFTCEGDPKDQKTFFCTLKLKFRGNGGKDYYKCPGYRLPTEAEWEFAALEEDSRLSFCEQIRKEGDIPNFAVYFRHSPEHLDGLTILPVPVAVPNQLGIHDLISNVREWVWDGYSEDYFAKGEPAALRTDPVGRQPLPTLQCLDCPKQRSEDRPDCHPCFRSMRGGHYDSLGPVQPAAQTIRYKRHLLNLPNDPTDPFTAPRQVGFRVARSIIQETRP